MGADDPGLNPSQRIRLEHLAEGIDSDAMVHLASQPADWKAIDGHEIEVLFRAALAEIGLAPPSREASGWTMARWIAASMIERVVPPDEGALRLWNLWDECGRAGELAESRHALGSLDAVEASVNRGNRRRIHLLGIARMFATLVNDGGWLHARGGVPGVRRCGGRQDGRRSGATVRRRGRRGARDGSLSQ